MLGPSHHPLSLPPTPGLSFLPVLLRPSQSLPSVTPRTPVLLLGRGTRAT